MESIRTFLMLASLVAGSAEDIRISSLTFVDGVFCSQPALIHIVAELVTDHKSLNKIVDAINKEAEYDVCDIAERKTVGITYTAFEENVQYGDQIRGIYRVQSYGARTAQGFVKFPEVQTLYTLGDAGRTAAAQ